MKTIKDFIDVLLAHELDIRMAACADDNYYTLPEEISRAQVDLDYGSCDVIGESSLCSEEEFDDYSAFICATYDTHYPVRVPGEGSGAYQFHESVQLDEDDYRKYMWGEGAYADARWAFLKAISEKLEELE